MQQWPFPTPEPGVYFNMPFEDYLKIDAMSSSAIKNLLVGPTEYWWKSSWNPLKEELDETLANKEGRAFHTRILEGRKRFHELYAPEFEIDPHDTSIIKDSSDLKEALRAVGAKVTFATKREGITRLLDADPKARILENLKAEHAEIHKGKEFLKPKTFRYIELSCRVVECHEEYKYWFKGGYPEVTVIWHDEELGGVFRARFDFLKIMPVVDLKSFANVMKKSIERATNKNVADFMYFIQVYLYLRAVTIAKKFVQEGKVFDCSKERLSDGLYPPPTDIDPGWLKAFSTTPCEEFWWCFVQKGVPTASGVKMLVTDEDLQKDGKQFVTEAMRTFWDCYNRFGTDMWLDTKPSRVLTMKELPQRIYEI